MAERKVLSKYYPPDFDPSAIERSAKGSRKDGKSSKFANVRLMTPFSMKCTHCGEYIPKGRKFNARKETTEERYLSVQIFRFYIRCTRCSGEITFRTDPKNNDYQCEHGAKRNFEVWRDAKDDKYQDETEEQTLDRLEKEHGEKEEQIERDKMAELEDKMLDSKREMKVADALDEIRTRNARIERKEAGGAEAALATAQVQADEEALRAEQEAAADAEAIRQEFREKKRLARNAQIKEEERQIEEEREKLLAPLRDPDYWKPKRRRRRDNEEFRGSFGKKPRLG
ncbi:hypothetical protein PENCOP_c013G01304 [Penicillium coprophilum]|uniref:Splicing factor YJU2 n=1 Tax=Penicillium coprophilum TaxID=36646 RepID=A0A1V6UAC6_9EURO|nr:hypothetical protein PENCOP_c013G01304 [Penicillium coprophilum]